MRYRLGALVIVAAALFGWVNMKEDLRAKHEAEHRWIYGFHVYGYPRPFEKYLEPVTSEGLREIRWDHQPRKIDATTIIAATTSSTVFTLATTSGAWTTCSMSPTSISYARY